MKELEQGRSTNTYKKLIVISLPHEDGLLLQNMSAQLKELVTHNIQKNVLQLSHADLIDFLHKNTESNQEKND